MGYYYVDIAIDTFEPDPDRLIRVRRYDIEEPVEIGQIVSVCDDECHGFARVVKFEGDPDMGFACLKELTGTEGEKLAEERELDWCDDLDG